MTLDMTQGVLRMEVPDKFRGARTKLVHPLLVNPAENNLHLVIYVQTHTHSLTHSLTHSHRHTHTDRHTHTHTHTHTGRGSHIV